MSKGTLLVIEPDFDIRKMLDMYFSGQGFNVVTSDRTSGIFKFVESISPDVLLINIHAITDNEITLISNLRSGVLKYSPIINIVEMSPTKLSDFEAGYDDFVQKPFDLEKLRLRITNALNYQRQLRSLNPVTNLPAANLIEVHMKDLLREENYDWVYLDVRLQYFEAFSQKNDIEAVHNLLRDTALWIVYALADDDFAGHPTMDRFIIISHTKDVKKLFESLLEKPNNKQVSRMPLSFGICDVSLYKDDIVDIRMISEIAEDDRLKRETL